MTDVITAAVFSKQAQSFHVGGTAVKGYFCCSLNSVFEEPPQIPFVIFFISLVPPEGVSVELPLVCVFVLFR